MTELLTNGDFEAWTAGLPTGWEKIGTQTIAQETVDVHTGSKAVKGTTTGPGCGIKQLIAGVAASQRCRLQVWQHVDAAAVAENYRVCAELQIVGGTFGGLFLNFSTGEWEEETPANEKNLQLLTRPISTRYVQLGYEFSAPPEGTSIRLFLKRVDGNPFSFWFDSASLATVPVPATPTSIDWGEYAHSTPNKPAVLDTFISEFGTPDYIGMYREWGKEILTPADIETLDARGIVPTISWEATEETHSPKPAEIVSGSEDAYIDAQAKIIADYGKPVIMRPFWEMNLTWMFGERVDPDAYIEAWHYIVDRFKAKGATNALWFWCPSIDYDRGEGTKFETIHDFFPYFPGDEYVDYVGADGYSTAFYNEELKKAGWATIEEIYFYTYHCLMGLSEKPFMIGETGVEEEGGDKAKWFSEGLTETIPGTFPRIRAIFYFNRHNTGEPEWEIETTPESHKAFREAIGDPLYSNESEQPTYDVGTYEAGTYGDPANADIVRRRESKPPIELDWEVETLDATYALSSSSDKAADRPRGGNFSTVRGDGFGTGGVTLLRPIFRDYPDIGLLDTWRAVGRNGDVAYEGRLASNPRGNDPAEQISISLVGWMTYLKNRGRIRMLIIDGRTGSWTGPSLERETDLSLAGFRLEGAMSTGWQDAGAAQPGIVFTFQRFDGGVTSEIGEAFFYAGGEDIGKILYSFDPLGNTTDVAWSDRALLSVDDLVSEFLLGEDHNQTIATDQVLEADDAGYKYAVLQSFYAGAAEGDILDRHGWLGPRVLGTHDLPMVGGPGEEGPGLTATLQYMLARYFPKIEWAGEDNEFPLQQFTFHDNPQTGYDILQQANGLVLCETNVWEDRKLHFHPADLTKYDWEIDTDEPGQTCLFEGPSIENFANGVVVTFTNLLSGRVEVLYPDEHPELLDPNENNPATRYGEPLWTDTEPPQPCTRSEALQWGRVYLTEWNRPKRPAKFRVVGHVRDGARHWRQAWKVRNSQSLGIKQHPADSPRLITATNYDEETAVLDITVDAPDKTLTAIVARGEQARTARNL